MGIFLFALLLLKLSFASSQHYEGEVTAYGSAWEGGACLYQSLPEEGKRQFVAINRVLWMELGMQNVCGRCVKMEYNGNAAIGMISNLCPECKRGDLDLSDALYYNLTGSTPSRLPFKWSLEDCDERMGVSGNIHFFIKDGSNPWWLAVQPVNFKVPMIQMSIEYPMGKVSDMPFGVGGLNYYIAQGLAINGPFTLRGVDKEGVVYTAFVDRIVPSTYVGTLSSSKSTISTATAPTDDMDSVTEDVVSLDGLIKCLAFVKKQTCRQLRL